MSDALKEFQALKLEVEGLEFAQGEVQARIRRFVEDKRVEGKLPLILMTAGRGCIEARLRVLVEEGVSFNLVKVEPISKDAAHLMVVTLEDLYGWYLQLAMWFGDQESRLVPKSQEGVE